MEKNIKNRNYIEMDSGDIYCLDFIESIIKNANNNNYTMFYKNNMQIVLTPDEYEFVKNLLKKHSNSYNIH